MPSLKEVKTRIGSVKSTRKITNAMKMVASSKLHHAQRAIECMRPYEKRLASIMTRFLSTMEGEVESVYSETREIRKVALVVISSNSSLCGAFNANIIKEFLKELISLNLKLLDCCLLRYNSRTVYQYDSVYLKWYAVS